MSDYIFSLEGTNADLFVSEDAITLQGKSNFTNILAFGTGNPTIPISSICSINFGTGSKGGSIEFSVLGDARQTTYNRNLILFKKKDTPNAEKIKDYIENRMTELKKPIKPESHSGADELRKFKQLLDDGIISKEEFEAKKKQILSQ